MHGERAVLDLALGIQVAMKGAPARAAVDELDAADLDDAMIELGLQARGLRVEHDLSHGPRVYRNAWLRQCVDRRIGEAVDTLVAGHAGVTGHPVPLDLVPGGELGEPLPQILVLHRLAVRGAPAARLPVRQPVG